MSRRLLLALLGACALLTSQGLVRGQYPPSYQPGYPAYPNSPMMPQTYPPGSYYPPPAYPQATSGYPGTSPLPVMPTPLVPAAYVPAPMNPVPSAPLPTPQPAPGNLPPGTLPAPTPSPAPGNTPPKSAPAAPSAAPSAGANILWAGESGGDVPYAEAGACARPGAGGDGCAGSCNRVPAYLPTVGDFFAVRYRHAFLLPVGRTINYSLFNSSATSSATVSLAPVRSGGMLLPTTVTSTSVGTIPVPAGQITNVTLAPGGSGVVTATGIVPTVASFIDYAASRGAIKISDFDSPRPRDRVYVTGAYYNSIPDNIRPVPGPVLTTVNQPIPATSPEVVSSLVGNTGTFFDASQVDQINTQFQRDKAQLVREIVGFEKTLELGGVDGSFGMRLPFFQFISDDSFKDVGDLSLIWKAIVCGGFDTEDLVTVGLVVTLPTGQKLITPQGEIKSVLIQPWAGYYYTLKRCYVQGFTGVVIPSESKDVGFSYTNLTLGYRLYESCKCNPLISLVAVQGEVHANTPFDHPTASSLVLVNNFFVANAAMHVGFGDHSLLTLGFGTPFGGYRPYEFQGTAMLNLFF